VAIALAVSLLGSCAGERPTLGTLPPSVPSTIASESTTTTAVAPPPAVEGVLGPQDLLGWIATPNGDPIVYEAATEESAQLDIPAETSAGAPTTFAIIGDASPGSTLAVPGGYEVALPTRPNGSRGWVPASSVTIAKTPFRIFVELEGRTLRVERDGAGVFTAEIAIGTEENPTPENGTYVTELIESIEPDGAYGPYAFGLAMHSDTLTEFAGGPGQVGIHGTNRPELIGERVSSGCVRLSNADIEELVALQLPLGVPVFITA
jgi:lipoprotein-anchoring transpeptidase ErfK/SrfK